ESEKSCNNLTGLLSELSDLANLEAGHLSLRRERIDLAPILARVEEDVHEGEDRGITLRVAGCSGAVFVFGDPVRLTTALTTLVAATLRERADGMSMVVACRHVDVPAGRTLRIAIGDRDAVETLLDDEEPAADTFDEYRGGLGFRLVLASRIIGAHGGRVSSPVVDPGRLAIVVTLPVAP
ncbi:MAG TPA: hypothetical protein VF332_08740, partial [Vicinamibacterales bacterium]